MSGYYAANPHFSPDDFGGSRERLERAEFEAARWFNYLTKPQLARYNARMAAAAAYKGAPRWDREHAAAEREFKDTTQAATRVCEMVFGDMMAFGEITEATSYAFDQVLVEQAMLQAAE